MVKFGKHIIATSYSLKDTDGLVNRCLIAIFHGASLFAF
jgi:hypothetical protein